MAPGFSTRILRGIGEDYTARERTKAKHRAKLWATPLTVASPLPASLTSEDREYIEARLSGKSDAQIARERNVKMETISQRRYRIAQRLELDTDIESFLFGQLRGSPPVAEARQPGTTGSPV